MRVRVGVVGAVVAVVVAIVVALAARPADVAAAPRTSPSVLETAELPPATRVVPPPAPRFSRTIYAATTMPASDPLIDACKGPVAIDLGDTRPLLVAEHDYCGGSAWMPRLRSGETVELDGPGVDPGLYVVTDIAFGQRRQARISDLPDAEVVLQTCISGTEITMVGLERAEPVVTS